MRPTIPTILAILVLALILSTAAFAGGPGAFAFDEDTVVVLESATEVTILVERSQGEDGEVSVDYSVTGGTATAGSDYQTVGGTLSWAHNDGSSRLVTIPLIPDGVAEPDETILLTLSNPTNGATIRPGRGQMTITILDDDGGGGGGGGGDVGVVKFDEDTVFVTESANQVTVLVERSQGENGAISVDYSVTGGTATPGEDYESVGGTLSWPHNDGSHRTIVIPLLPDTVAEPNETIELALMNPTNGAVILPGRGESTVVILDDDGGGGGGGGGGGEAGVFKFDQSNFSALEGIGMAVISVERSQGESGAATVDYSALAGTATAGADFEEVTGRLSWASGDGASKTFLVPIFQDGEIEGSETVNLRLENPTGGAVLDPQRGSSVLTILDDDAIPGGGDRNGTLKFGERLFVGIEDLGTGFVEIERSQGSQGAVSVRMTTADISATAGADYRSVDTVVHWGPGDSSTRIVEIPLIPDNLVEGSESLSLRLSQATGGASIDRLRGESTLEILDDDGSMAACAPGSTTLCLQGNRFEAEIEWRTANGNVGSGRARSVTTDSGLFSFFSESNLEMLVKVIDACAHPSQSYWVFYAATTNVDFTLTIRDTQTGIVKEYRNPLGLPAAPIQDLTTFRVCN